MPGVLLDCVKILTQQGLVYGLDNSGLSAGPVRLSPRGCRPSAVEIIREKNMMQKYNVPSWELPGQWELDLST